MIIGYIVLIDLTICIELWIGGVLIMKNDALQYNGGKKFEFSYVNFDKLNYKDLFEMYGLYGMLIFSTINKIYHLMRV